MFNLKICNRINSLLWYGFYERLPFKVKTQIMSERKVILSMQMTLDGYVSGHDDKADWMQTSDEAWEDLFNDLETADTYLLGRKMYPLYSSYWQSVLKNPDS